MNADFDIVRIVDSDEEDTSLVPLVTENDAWEYGAELPEIEVTPEQLQEENSLIPANARITIPDFCQTLERYYGK